MTETGNRGRVGWRGDVVRGNVVLWPSRRSDLVDTTRCPACFEKLASPVCGHCGLDLRHPAAADLLSTSVSIADALDRRAEIIGRIRIETDAAAHARREADEHARRSAAHAQREADEHARRSAALTRRDIVAPASVQNPQPASAHDLQPASAQDPQPASAPAPPSLMHVPPPPGVPPVGSAPPIDGQAEPPRRRVSSVQLALLIAGVSLLSVFAIFFLVYAFINYGIIWRSVIIGAITVAAFTTAIVLHRRGLRTTAEGIAVLAIVLVYLDAFALRANDLFGAADVAGSLYWGITLVIAAVGFIVWHRVSGLRAPSLVGFVTLAPGVGIIAYGLTEPLEFPERTVLVLSAAAGAGLVHRFAGRATTASSTGTRARVERSVVLATTAVSLAGSSTLAVLVEPTANNPTANDPNSNDPTASLLGLVVVVLIAASHLGVLWSLPERPRGWAGAISVPLGISTATLGVAFWLHTGTPDGTLVLPTVVAVIAALGFDSVSRRVGDPMLGTAGRAAAISSAVVLGIVASVPLGSALLFTGAATADAVDRAWTIGPLDPLADPAVADVLVVVALAFVGILAAVAWRIDGLLLRRAPALGFYAAGVLALAAPLAGAAALVMGVWLALAAVALIVVATGRERIGPLRPALITLYGVTLALGWTAGWASESTWPVAAGATVLLLGAGRAIVPDGMVAGRVGRAGFLAASTVMLLVAAATAVRQLGVAADPPTGVWLTDVVRGVTAVAAAIMILAAVVPGRLLSGLDRRVLFWLHGSVAVVGVLVTRLVVVEPRGLILPSGSVDRGTFLGVVDSSALAVGIAALLLVAVVLFVAPRRTAMFRTERMTASVALAPTLWLLLDGVLRRLDAPDLPLALAPATAGLVIAVISLAVHVRRPTRIPRNFRELGVAITGAGALVLTVGDDAPLLWVVFAALALAAGAASVRQSREPLAAVGFGIAAVLVPLAAGHGADALVSMTDAGASSVADANRFAALSLILLLAVAALRLEPIVPTLARRTVFWTALVLVGATDAYGRISVSEGVLLDTAAAGLVSHALLVGALLLWGVRRSTSALRLERIVASVALGPAIYLVVDSFVQVVDAPELARSVAPVTAALLSAVGSLAVALLRRASTIPRGLREMGVALVGVPAVIVAAVNVDGSTWLVLLFSAVTVLIVSISADGLFASRSPRRYLGWGAIVLAVAGLWVRLSENSVGAVEPYVLPLSGVLLLVALLLWRAGRRAGAVSPVPPLVGFAGLLVGILPVASVSATGAPVRAIVVGAVSASLLLVSSFVRARVGARPVVSGSDGTIDGTHQSSGIRPYLDVAALAGAIGVTVTIVGRAWVLTSTRPGSGEVDAWLGVGVGVLIVSAFGIATIPPDRFSAQRMLGARVISLIPLTASTAIECMAIARTDGTLLRPLAVVFLLSALHVIAFTIDRLPLDRLLAWVAIAYAAIVAGLALASGSLDPVETGTLPIAIALIATGVVRLGESEKPRSWPWLGPGVVVLLLPSLLATINDRPLWRLVGIGVVGVAIVVIGLMRRLQAPFVIGTVVVVVHAVATFAPQIRSVYESVAWWLWLGIGGLILTVLAARYEQRIRNLRDVVERIGSLR